MPYLETRPGMCWAFEVAGNGPAVLFLHGWGVDGRIWRQQVKYFCPSFRTIVIDLPGHGGTRWQPLTLEEIAGEMQGILTRLEVSSCHVVASSLGGLVALALAALAPEKMRTMTFVGSQPKFVKSEDYPFGLAPQRVEKLAAQLRSDYPAIVHIFFRSLFSFDERQGRRYRWIQTFRRAIEVPQQEALIGLLDLLTRADLRRTLASLTAPLLFVNGREDPICPPVLYEDIARARPGVRLAWFEDCGHFPFLTHPYEFNETVSEFWSAAGLKSGGGA